MVNALHGENVREKDERTWMNVPTILSKVVLFRILVIVSSTDNFLASWSEDESLGRISKQVQS